MGMRITTNMIRRNYQNNLSNTIGGLTSSRKQVETGRRFASSYEDPSAAAKGAILDRRYMRNGDYLNSVKNTQKWQDTQEEVVDQINTYVVTIDEDYSVEAMNGTNIDKDVRAAYASALRGLQESMIYSLNTKYGDSYVMGGNNGGNPPFTLGSDGLVYYRGVNVDGYDPDNPYGDLAVRGDRSTYQPDEETMKVLNAMSKEKSYIDLGFGMTFGADGEIVPSTAFDSALPGLNVVGFGMTELFSKDVSGNAVDANGESAEPRYVSNNVISLAGQMAKLLEADEFDVDAYEELWTHFHQQRQNVQNNYAALGTKTQLLTATQKKLEAEKLNLEEQYKDTVGIEEAEAITNFSYAQYAYNVALKIGTSIISPSLLDFMD